MIANMIDTMYDEVGIGLAAPQVGIALRLIVLADEEAAASRRSSIPRSSSRAARSRARKAACRFPACSRRSRAPRGEGGGARRGRQAVAITARGLRARVLQHEIDHLDGVLFIDHVDPMTRDRIKRKIKKEGLREDASRHAFAL